MGSSEFTSLVSDELISHLITSIFTFPLPVICKSDLSLSSAILCASPLGMALKVNFSSFPWVRKRPLGQRLLPVSFLAPLFPSPHFLPSPFLELVIALK